MKIVNPSAEILDHLDQQSLAVRIEECGRICYKSEDRITPDSALPFLEKVIKSGHNSVLEMGVVTLEVDCSFWDYFDLLEASPKYLHLSKVMPGGDRTSGMDWVRLLITASIRAWREMLINHPDCTVVQSACALLFMRNTFFFNDIIPADGLSMPNISVRKVPLEKVERLPDDLFAKHRYIAVKFVVSRAISHQLVRHRSASFLQESMRYCNYASGKFGGEVTFIKPSAFWDCETSGECELCGCDNQLGEFCYDCLKSMRGAYSCKITASEDYIAWLEAMQCAEDSYLERIQNGSSPQAARTVLPNSCKTEIIVYTNLEQWLHIFKLRCSKAAEPSMREVMVPLREEFAKRWPEVFRNE